MSLQMLRKYAIFLSNSQPLFKINKPEVNFVAVTTSVRGEGLKLVLAQSKTKI